MGLASGFIVQRSGSLFLISAGHALRKEGWCLETDVHFEDTHETLLLPLNDVMSFTSVDLTTFAPEPMEFAFALLDIEKLNAQACEMNQRLPDEPISFTTYLGPLDDEPVPGEADYSYASWHSKGSALYTDLSPQSPGKYRLDRQAGVEFGMTYLGRTPDGGLYRFALAGTKRKDDYYRGSSGAPIVDRRGKVVSVLIGADCSPNVLTGLPVKDYARFLDLGIW